MVGIDDIVNRMTITVTDRDLTHYVEETLPEPGFDVAAIVAELRPYIQFGDVSPGDYVPADDGEEFDSHVDSTAALIDYMLRANGITEDAYWAVVERHDGAAR